LRVFGLATALLTMAVVKDFEGFCGFSGCQAASSGDADVHAAQSIVPYD
jgi:hypothetical protein